MIDQLSSRSTLQHHLARRRTQAGLCTEFALLNSGGSVNTQLAWLGQNLVGFLAASEAYSINPACDRKSAMTCVFGFHLLCPPVHTASPSSITGK